MTGYNPTAPAVNLGTSEQAPERDALHLLCTAVERLQAAGPAYEIPCLAAGQLHLLIARQIAHLDAQVAA